MKNENKKELKKEILNCKCNHKALMTLTASKYNEKITVKQLYNDYPELHFELKRLGDLDYSIVWINSEIIFSNRS